MRSLKDKNNLCSQSWNYKERYGNDPTWHKAQSKRYYGKSAEAIKAPARTRSNDESIRVAARARLKLYYAENAEAKRAASRAKYYADWDWILFQLREW